MTKASFSINILYTSVFIYTHIAFILIMEDNLNSEHRHHYLLSEQFFHQVTFFENLNVYFM